MSSYLTIAVRAAKKAGAVQKAHYGRVRNIQYKSKNKLNLVTEVDQRCEKIVLSMLKASFPTHNLWGEESGQGSTSSEYTWLVDPLDGTTNYAHSYPFFCVSIALVKDNEPVVGVIYDALRNELFTAEKGKGSFLNGKRLKVSPTKSLSESLLSTGFAYAVRETHYNLDNFRRFVLTAQGVRRDGSAAMNLAYVAAGRFDGFWERGIQAWDMAAGVLMVREAGGRVTDINGKPFDLLAQNALASNGKTHQAIFKTLWKGKDEKNWMKKWAHRARPQ
ncbi:MAG TPA: inositol monophosphatase family protein [bacterium]|nr:inositol monophosphatase family protein [bacterium]